MAIPPGTRLGAYEVTAQIGEGGMGQVYRARDTRLDRDVAIKIIPEAFAGDADRLARFQREAKTLASLNHPNIAAIYGLEEADGVKALVMELVEGPTLADVIAGPEGQARPTHPDVRRAGPIGGPAGGAGLPVDEALAIAKQITDALEAAHEQGIIHRDLKPANIKVRPDGTVKVLDFGLAKAVSPAGPEGQARPTYPDERRVGPPGPTYSDERRVGPPGPTYPHERRAGPPFGPAGASESPTITMPAMTEAGMILGTAAYMSPEQARGKPVDRRADIWAFGVVLFEMLTGTRPFAGDGVSETLARVIEREPAWDTLPAAVPAHVRQTLHLCLRKSLRERVPDIGAVRLALDGAFETAASETPSATPSRGRLVWGAALALAIVAAALAVPAFRYLRETPPPTLSETRVDIVTSATDDLTSFALSPDGRQIAYVATEDGVSRLWMRSLAATAPQALAGTEGGRAPFWSPDSRSVGFFSDGALKRVDLGGGAPQVLARADNGVGGTWNGEGVIVFAPSLTSPLMRVSASGGAVTAITTLGAQQAGHGVPWFLPDGHALLFRVRGAPETAGIYLGTLDGGTATRLTPADSAGVYMPAGWLAWVRDGTLVAQRLDVEAAALTGEPMTLADRVAVDGRGRSAVSVAATGLVAYRTGSDTQLQLTWVDRSGTAQDTAGEPDATIASPRVSPDGRRVVVSRTVQGNQDLWLLDGARTSRVTFDAASDGIPIWSHDGSRIVFRSLRTGGGDLYVKLTTDASAEVRLVSSDQLKIPTDWSADNRTLLYSSIDPTTNMDLWVLPMTGAATPSLFLRTPFRELWGTFSPDGRWVAYHSNESGRNEVYVRAVGASGPGSADGATGSGAASQVSTAGGIMPTWRPDGKEIFYLNPAGAMMAAPIAVTGSTLEPGAPVVLFSTRISGGGVDAGLGRQYDVAPDGRFLINMELDRADAPITLLMNWNPGALK